MFISCTLQYHNTLYYISIFSFHRSREPSHCLAIYYRYKFAVSAALLRWINVSHAVAPLLAGFRPASEICLRHLVEDEESQLLNIILKNSLRELTRTGASVTMMRELT